MKILEQTGESEIFELYVIANRRGKQKGTYLRNINKCRYWAG